MPWRLVSHTSLSETDGPINWRIHKRIRETLKLTKGANVNDNEILKTVVRDVVHHILRIPSEQFYMTLYRNYFYIESSPHVKIKAGGKGAKYHM